MSLDSRYLKPGMETRSYRNLAILVSALLLGIFLWKLWADGYLISSEETRPSGMYPSSVSRMGDLRITGAVERSYLRTDETMLIWLTLENTGSSPVSELTIVEFQPDGLTEVGSCWKAGLPDCFAGEPSGSAQFHQKSLEARSAVTLWGEIAPSTGKGNFRPFVTVAWKEGQNQQQLTLHFQSIEIQAAAKTWIAKLGVSAYSLFKDFAIPIVALIVGFFFDKMRQREQAETEAAATKEAQIGQTWHLMLPKVHKNAERFYMPISSEIQNLLLAHKDYEKFRADKSDAASTAIESPVNSEIEARFGRAKALEKHEEKVMFHLIRLYRRFKAMGQEIGGFYFKSRKGEHLAAHAWVLFTERLFDYFDYREIEKYTSLMDPQEDIDAFLARGKSNLASMEAFVKMRETAFFPWLRRASTNDLDILRILEQVLDYEMNQAYQWWYGKEEEIDTESCRQWLKQIKNDPKAKSTDFFKAFTEAGKKYFE